MRKINSVEEITAPGWNKTAWVLFVYMTEDVFHRLTFCGGADTIKERNSANE